MKRREEMTEDEVARIAWATAAAIPEFENLPFFDRVNAQGRFRIADTLARMIGTADIPLGQKEELIFSKRGGYEYVASKKTGGRIFTPDHRLNWIIDVVVEDWGKWPEDGLRDLRSAYCRFFTAADGNEIEATEMADKAHHPMPPVQPNAFIPGPDDEPVGEDLMKQIEDAAAAKRGGK